MQQLNVSIYPDLTEAASIRSFKGVLDDASYKVGGVEFLLPDGIQYNLELTNTGEGVFLSGQANCTAITSCARCLAPAQIEVLGDVEGYYLLEAASSVDGYEDDEFEVIAEGGTFDIAPAIVAALVHATPFVVLCKDDCAGICPQCGADLNLEPCDCNTDGSVDELNPFAALKDLKFED